MIYPIPKSEKYFDVFYSIKDNNVCNYGLVDLYNCVKNGNFECTLDRDDRYKKEEYKLKISVETISITFSDDEGLFRAVTSLYQLIKKQEDTLKCTEIHDLPDVKRRGYMLDISRGRIPKPEVLKKIIDGLAELKYNELQLYMESFCFKYKHFAKYTEDFDCLTPDDIKEIALYCKERFIDLVPNQNTFGHMHAWIAQKELRHLGIVEGDDNTGTLNPLLPETVEFIDKIFDSLLPFFSSEYVNIGFDEADGLGRYQTEEYFKEHGVVKAYTDYLQKINKIINDKYGKKTMIWADFFSRHDGVHEKIPNNVIALEWGYDLICSQLMDANCMKLKENNIPFYVCPSCMTHLCFTGRTDVMTFNVRTAGELAKKYEADGYLLTDWMSYFLVWSIVPIALGAQYAWNSGEKQLGWSFKEDFIQAAYKYVDDNYFGGEDVSKPLSLLGNYYLLEQERVHNETLSSRIFNMSLDTEKEPLKDYEDSFTNENIKNYINHYWNIIESKPISEQVKMQISVSCRMVILAAEFSNVRLGYNLTIEKIDGLITMAEQLKQDFYNIWLVYHYEKGSELFLNAVDNKITELKSIVSKL